MIIQLTSLSEYNPMVVGFLNDGSSHRSISYNIIVMDDKENNLLIFKKSRTPIKKRVLDKPILPRRESRDLKDKSLPELNLEKNKLTEYFKTYQPFGKETLQQDILKLKERNNQLIHQNTRLKTVITNLERDNGKFQKLMLQNRTPLSSKTLGECNVMSLKQLLRECKKQLMEQKNQNISIKKSLKYSKMGEIELENKYLKEETLRLRNIIGVDVGVEFASQKEMQEESIARKFNLTLSRKIKSSEEKCKTAKAGKDQPTIDVLKRTIKEKEGIIEGMKIDGLKFVPKQVVQCQQCQKYKAEIDLKTSKIKQLEEKTKCVINNNSSTVIINNPPIPQHVQVPQPAPQYQPAKPQPHPNKQETQPTQQQSGFKMKRPSPQFYESLREFLRYRFQAHHLSLQELKSYILQEVDQTMSVDVFAELCLVEPFSIGNRDYLGALIGYLFYQDNQSEQFFIKDTDSKPTLFVISKLQSFLGNYQILDIKREEEMYMQIAQLITNYQKHIESALVNKRNGDGTISKAILQSFLVEIQLDQEYIEFIISQIILDSIDMDHLSYSSIFEIFIISPNIATPVPGHKGLGSQQMGASQLGKSVYSVMPVAELDQEYEQSQQSQQFRENEQKQREIEAKEEIQVELQQGGDDLGFHRKCQEIEEYEPIHDWSDQPIEQ